MGIGKRPLSEEEFRSIIEHTSIYFNFPTNVREKTIWKTELNQDCKSMRIPPCRCAMFVAG